MDETTREALFLDGLVSLVVFGFTANVECSVCQACSNVLRGIDAKATDDRAEFDGPAAFKVGSNSVEATFTAASQNARHLRRSPDLRSTCSCYDQKIHCYDPTNNGKA